jgi:hypothetical protein
MYVAEKAMAGCFPIVVLNEWDENYLSIIKNILSAKNKLGSVHTLLIFATGENGIDAACEAFSEDLEVPVVLLPSDANGQAIKRRLLDGTYEYFPTKILMLGDIVKDAVKFEDLIPGNFVEIFSRVYLSHLLGEGFTYDKKKDIIWQIEDYAVANGIALPKNYRSELAKRMKINTMMHFKDVHISGKYQNNWMNIWRALLKA